jgi:hypothetical protein
MASEIVQEGLCKQFYRIFHAFLKAAFAASVIASVGL